MSQELSARHAEGLRHQDTVTADIASTAGALSPEGWATPTNCPPWDVKMLVAHMTRGAESFVSIVNNGLQGITEITQSREERERRQRELADLSGPELVATFQRNQGAYRDLLAGLSPSDLTKPGRHPWSMQPLWWFGDQRLAELALHDWDLHFSLGQEQEIDATVAQYLLPTIIERNVKAWYKPSPGSRDTWVLRATDVTEATWLIQPSSDNVSIGRQAADGDVTIEGDAAALVRWFYGRADIMALEKQGRVRLQGARDHASSWHTIFPAP